ncbi:MAG: hypothetical protein R3C41_09865 [Calditrichia bacterium]
MNPAVSFEISQFSIFQMLIIGTALFVVLRILRRMIRRLSVGRPAQTLLKRFWPLAETIVWVAFSLTSLAVIFDDRVFYTGAVLLVIVAISGWFFWFVLRDWMAGVILKIRNVLHLNQPLQIGDISGTVLRLGDLSLQLQQENGAIAEIPYAAVAGNILRTNNPDAGGSVHKFVVDVPQFSSTEAAQQWLRNAILQSPWWPPQSEPKFKIITENRDHFQIEVQLVSLDARFVQSVHRDVLQQINMLHQPE